MVRVTIQAHPRARRSAITGRFGDAWKLDLAAWPARRAASRLLRSRGSKNRISTRAILSRECGSRPEHRSPIRRDARPCDGQPHTLPSVPYLRAEAAWRESRYRRIRGHSGRQRQ